MTFSIALLVLERLNSLVFDLDVALSLETSLDSRLDFKAVFFKECQLLHQAVFLLNELLVVGRKLFSVFPAHR